jgi:hypothetical protein
MTTIEEVKKYMDKRYDNWLDRAKYHCIHAGIADEAGDVLNEVLCAILSYPDSRLILLYNEEKGPYRSLDLFVLKAIETNVWKATSGYQYKYHKEKYISKYHDRQILFEPEDAGLEIEDFVDDMRKKTETRMHQRFSRFCRKQRLDKLTIKIFRFRFFEHKKWSEWEGKESRYKLEKLYRQAKETIFRELKLNPEEPDE